MKNILFSQDGLQIQGLLCAASLAVSAVFAAAVPARAAQLKNPVVVGGARFTVITPECIRIEYQKDGKFIDAPSMFAVNRAAKFDGFKVSEQGKSTTIDTGVIKLTYTPDGKAFSDRNLIATIKKGGVSSEWKPGMPSAGNLGGTIRTVDGVTGPVDLGEGVISRDGWYLLDDSKKNIFTKDWVASRPKDAGLDWYLFGYGNDYAGALKTLTEIGGTIPLPRKYALGAWYSRYWPYSSKDYHDIINEYKSHDFPLDVIVMDMDWHKDNWTGWSWNRKLLPDAEDLLKWFHKQGLAVTLNLHPADGVGPHEDAYEKFMKDMGKDPAARETLPYDAGDKKYLDTLYKDVVAPLENDGVDFWWLDWQQYPFTRSIPDLTNLAWLNNYFYKWTGRGGLRGQSFSRWAGWGDHRYPIHFSGDAHTGWPMLSFEIAISSVGGNIGAFYWSHDIGGHMGPRNPESYTRWVQFGATFAALRSHSTRSADMDRRPWKYQKWAKDSMRISFHLRSVLFPYIYSSAWQCYKDSMPLNRPMYLLYPENENSYHNIQQYFYGDSLLVSPVSTPGVGPKRVGKQAVWFPKGAWYNWFTGEEYTGESNALVTADIDEFPIYAKGGAPIPLQNYTPRMATTPLKELVVRAYPGDDGATGKFTLYEDDGISLDYTKGGYATTALSYIRKGKTVTVTIAPAKGEFKGREKLRSYVIELPCTKKATGVNVDGAGKAKLVYDEKEKINRIFIPAMPLTKGLKATVTVENADPAGFMQKAAGRRLAGIDKSIGKGPSSAAVAEYSTTNPAGENLDMMLASIGVGLFKKNEGAYLYKGKETVYFYYRPGILDGNSFKFSVVERIGENDTDIYSKQMLAGAVGAVAAPPLPPMSPPPVFGVQAKRFVMVDFTINGRPVSLAREIEDKPSMLTKWSVAGVFPLDRNKNIESQQFGPEEKETSLSDSYAGPGGTKIKWRKAKCDPDGSVDLNAHFHIPQADKIAYAVTFIDSDVEQPVTFKIVSDDGAEMFLNGKKIFSKNSGRFRSFSTNNAESADGALKAGRNVLLVKVSQYWDEWGFGVAIGAKRPVTDSFGK